jgi:hypothetical protein
VLSRKTTLVNKCHTLVSKSVSNGTRIVDTFFLSLLASAAESLKIPKMSGRGKAGLKAPSLGPKGPRSCNEFYYFMILSRGGPSLGPVFGTSHATSYLNHTAVRRLGPLGAR